MIVERELYGTREKFFDILVEAIVEDANMSKSKQITIKDIKEGYSYSKTINERSKNKDKKRSKATIAKFNRPEEFCLKVASESGTTTLDYKIKYIDEENIKVIYKEEYRTKEGKIYDGFFYKRNLKKKANMYLDQLQEYMNTEE